MGLPWRLSCKKPSCQCRKLKFDPWVGKIPWRRAWQPIPVFLPGESLWTEKLDGMQSIGLKRVGHDWETKKSTSPIRWLSCKQSAFNAGDLGLIPESGRLPGGGHGNLLQYSCLENPYGQKSLVSYTPWGLKELGTTEWLNWMEGKNQWLRW